MNAHITRQLLTGVALAGTLAFVAACTGASSSMNPTSPSATASAAAGASFSPNPACGGTGQPPCPTPCEVDPTLPECTPESLDGRFTGGGFQINTGNVKVTRGFTIHCDNLLTNNLEVNWAGGNNFHMAKNTLTSVVCTRPVDPTPPAAPVARITASAVGVCNGLPATINFVLEDRGEPGTNDRAALFITGAGSCNLNLTERPIDGGNIQAHFDQPHK